MKLLKKILLFLPAFAAQQISEINPNGNDFSFPKDHVGGNYLLYCLNNLHLFLVQTNFLCAYRTQNNFTFSLNSIPLKFKHALEVCITECHFPGTGFFL